MDTPKITLLEIPRSLIELAAKKEGVGGNTAMRDALRAADNKHDPVFVKRKQSILVMEREQFNELQTAIGGTKAT